ncbi:MAG TPA: peptidylprolyl isomerase [Acidobacteriaceae bacterium]|jgi:peptidyl-prolyl cis-trans isomerase A (cyclophilin A)|nr:peptidylprolyl isomerase [Acidobacteriaceae bacterium]
MIPLRHSSLFAAAVLFSCSLCAQQTPTSTPAGQTPPAAPAPATQVQQSAPQPTSSLPDAPDLQAHPAPQPTGPTAIFDTSMGQMTCKLFDKQAPNAVANFVGLATGTKDWTDPATKQKVHGQPYYDGTTFHRVIPGFMIQGGDRLGTGEGDPGYMFKDEFDPNLNFDVPGRLAMANSGPDTNGSQFFITEAPYPSLDQHYVIFGQCDEHSVLVVESIARVNRDDRDKPVEPVVLKKVTIVPAGQPVPSAATPAASPQP